MTTARLLAYIGLGLLLGGFLFIWLGWEDGTSRPPLTIGCIAAAVGAMMLIGLSGYVGNRRQQSVR